MKIPLLQRIIESKATAPVEIFCDFDGTISTCDVTDRLLEELADPAWKKVEAAWENGEIGSRECMAQQVKLIRGGWKAVQNLLNSIQLEPSFKPFVKWCKDNNIQLHIVSDGLDKVIEYLLERNGIKVESVVANRLVESADGSFSLQFPYSIPDKFCTSGVCKCKILSDAKMGMPIAPVRNADISSTASNLLSRIGLLPRSNSQQSTVIDTKRIVIGDGRSDFCWANEADLVFAKSQLLEYCKDKHLHYVALNDFNGVAHYVERYLLTAPVPAMEAATEDMAPLPAFGFQPTA